MTKSLREPRRQTCHRASRPQIGPIWHTEAHRERATGAQSNFPERHAHAPLVITHKSDALRLARLFGKLAYNPVGEWRLLKVQQAHGPFNGR